MPLDSINDLSTNYSVVVALYMNGGTANSSASNWAGGDWSETTVFSIGQRGPGFGGGTDPVNPAEYAETGCDLDVSYLAADGTCVSLRDAHITRLNDLDTTQKICWQEGSRQASCPEIDNVYMANGTFAEINYENELGGTAFAITNLTLPPYSTVTLRKTIDAANLGNRSVFVRVAPNGSSAYFKFSSGNTVFPREWEDFNRA